MGRRIKSRGRWAPRPNSTQAVLRKRHTETSWKSSIQSADNATSRRIRRRTKNKKNNDDAQVPRCIALPHMDGLGGLACAEDRPGAAYEESGGASRRERG